jgi:5-methylcytosine-specific restriction protein A
MNYFMARIYSEGNLDSLKKPTSALWKHIVYYEEKNKVTLNALRDIASQYSILCDSVSDTDKITNNFHLLVTKSIEGDANNRKKRLATSQSKPKTRVIAVKIFDRNPDVVAEVLLRANGVCELCEKAAPFNRKKDNSPYLEVHHKKKLADGGDDNLNNAIGLCPNCHRKLHYGCNSN